MIPIEDLFWAIKYERDMKPALEEIRARFRERGVKVTPQRSAVYQALAERDDHPTAEALYRQVRRRYPMISPNTVYYTLSVLGQAGLVTEVNYWHDRSRFDANLDPHHHMLCLGCRKIQDITDAALDKVRVPTKERSGFTVTGHRVEFHGFCTACYRKHAETEHSRLQRQHTNKRRKR